jgi:hypothetical protein
MTILGRLRKGLKERAPLGDVSPFRECLAPPEVILGGRMELRKVKGDQSGILLSP